MPIIRTPSDIIASPPLTRWIRIVGAVSAWGGLALQYWVVMNADIPVSLTLRTAFFLTYFTVLSNAFAAVAFTVPLLSPRTKAAAFLNRPPVRAGIACYLAITCVVFLLVVRHQIPQEIRHPVSDALLHIVTPALMLGDWLACSPRGILRVKHAIVWLWFPTAFGGEVLGVGAATGFYPYPFLDVATLGAFAVAVNMAGLSLLFIGAGLSMVLLDRQLRLLSRRPPSSWRD